MLAATAAAAAAAAAATTTTVTTTTTTTAISLTGRALVHHLDRAIGPRRPTEHLLLGVAPHADRRHGVWRPTAPHAGQRLGLG